MEVESPIDDKRWITNEGELTDEEYAEYVRQVSDSEGFDVDAFPLTLPGMITPRSCRSPSGILFSQLALSYYNQINDADFEYVALDHHNLELVKGVMHYVTFKGKDATGSMHMFQGRVWDQVPGPNGEAIFEVLLCRLKPSEGRASQADKQVTGRDESQVDTQVTKREAQPENNLIERESQLEKQQKTETSEDTNGKQVVSEVVKDVDLDQYHEWLGGQDVTNMFAHGYYCQQVLSSKGFDLDTDIPLMFPGQIIPLDTFDYSRNVIHVFSDLALTDYEITNSVNPCFFFEEVKKVNVQTNLLEVARTPFKAKRANFYITFMAKNKELGLTRTFQTLVRKSILEDGNLEIKIVSVKLLSTEKGI